MNNNLLRLRVVEKLNKLDSNDYDSIECWKIVQAFNEEQLKYASELSKIGEGTLAVIDDIEFLLKTQPIKGINKKDYFETVEIPKDMMRIRRVEVEAVDDTCSIPQKITVYDGEESEVDILLKDETKNPNFKWRETFKTVISKKIRVYTQNKFKVTNCSLIYYRYPTQISFEGCIDEYNNITSDKECEFKDNVIVSQLIPRVCASIAGDIENFNQVQRNIQTINT